MRRAQRGWSRTAVVAGIVLVAAVVGILVLVADRPGDPSRPPSAVIAPAAPADAEAAPSAAVPTAVESQLAPAPTNAVVQPASAAAPAVVDWDRVPVVARVSDLGPALARDVYEGLRSARGAMDGCFKAAARAESAQPAAAPPPDAFGPPIVTLHLDAREGELVVAAAPLQELGSGTLSLVDCCEKVLRGYRIPAKAATPGARYRLQYELMF